MSDFDVSELSRAVIALLSETARLNQAASALLSKFEALDGLAFSEFDRSLAVTAGWHTLADTIGASGLHIHEQAIRLQSAGARLLAPFDIARQRQAQADTDSTERAERVTAYANAETDTKTESDAFRQRLRLGEKLSASELNQARELGVLLPPTELATTQW